MPGRTAETAKMVAELDLKTGGFTKGVATAVAAVGRLGGAVAKSRAVAVGLGVGLEHAAEKGLSLLGQGIGNGIDSLLQLEDATTAVDAAITATGKTGQVTSAQVAGWANEIESNIHAAFDDKEITAAAATLLRFGNVTTQNLRPALVVMTDLAAKTGDIDSAATLLAKALADPAKAAGKLAKQGVILTSTQQDQLTSLTSLNKEEQKHFAALAKVSKAKALAYKDSVIAAKQSQAQAFLLDILSKKTKGAADATQGPLHKAISTFKDVVEDAQRALAIGFLPLLTRVADFLRTQLARPEVIQSLKDFGTAVAKLFDKGLDFAAKIPWGSIASALKIAADAANAILNAFLKMPKWAQTAIITGAIAKIAINNIPGVGGGGGGGGDGGGGLAGKAIEGVAGGLAHAIGAELLTLIGGTTFAASIGAAIAAAAPFIALAALPAALIGLTLAITKITDPTGERNTQGKADTATARHIPDWNNKALQELKGVNSGISELPGKLADDLVPLLPKTAEVATAIQKAGAQRDAELSAAIKSILPTGKQQDDTAMVQALQAIVTFVPTVKLDASQITDLRGPTAAAFQTAFDKASSARDTETSSSIQSLIAQTDLVAKSADIASLSGVTDQDLATLSGDTTRGASQTSSAATGAGFHAAGQTFASGIGIENAVRQSRPIIDVTVNISATTVRDTVTVADRGGSRSGSRDGDGGGGPGQ